MTMHPEQAVLTLRRVLEMKAQEMSWRRIAAVLGLETPQEAKKLAKQAARESQAYLAGRLNAQR